jgi:hypothetical protein
VVEGGRDMRNVPIVPTMSLLSPRLGGMYTGDYLSTPRPIVFNLIADITITKVVSVFVIDFKRALRSRKNRV